MDNPEICKKIEEQVRETFKTTSENDDKQIEYDSVDDVEDEEFDGSLIENDIEETNGIELEEED